MNMLNMRVLLASCVLALAGPAFGQDTQDKGDNQVIQQGQEEMGTLVDALAPKAPVRTRSIRMLNHEGGPEPVAQKPAKVSLLITFETNSATLTPRSRQSLEVVGQALGSEKLAPYRFAIEGHADPRGNPADNLKLSQARAQSVRAYLVDSMHIDAARLEAVGKGDREQMNKANPEAPENRRVTIVNLSR